MTQTTHYNAIVIGAGQVGGPLSMTLARSGWKTAFIERVHVGGTCINEGCTPTKTMVASGRVAYLARRGADYGVQTCPVTIDMTKVRQRKRHIVESFRTSGQRRIEKTEGVDLLMGGVPVTIERNITMHKTTILFGYPTDPAAFDRHYHEVHLPLTRKLKGIKGLTIGKLDASDNGEKAPYYLITSIYTDSREVLDSTLATAEGQAVLKDTPNFATGGFTLLHDDEEILIPLTLS